MIPEKIINFAIQHSYAFSILAGIILLALTECITVILAKNTKLREYSILTETIAIKIVSILLASFGLVLATLFGLGLIGIIEGIIINYVAILQAFGLIMIVIVLVIRTHPDKCNKVIVVQNLIFQGLRMYLHLDFLVLSDIE